MPVRQRSTMVFGSNTEVVVGGPVVVRALTVEICRSIGDVAVIRWGLCSVGNATSYAPPPFDSLENTFHDFKRSTARVSCRSRAIFSSNSSGPSSTLFPSVAAM